MKCAYKYCKLGGEVKREDATKAGNRYWHKECFAESKRKNDIYDYYITAVDNNVNKQALRGAIKGVVNDKNYDADFVLFAVKYAHEDGVVMNSPYSLHYIVENTDVIKAWKKKIDSEQKRKLDKILKDIDTAESTTFKTKTKKPKWMELL